MPRAVAPTQHSFNERDLRQTLPTHNEEPLLTLETLRLSLKTLDHQEEALFSKVDALQAKRSEMEILSKLMHELSLAKRHGKDFNVEEDEVKKLIICVHRSDQRVFGEFITAFPEGLLTQPFLPQDPSLQGFIKAATQDLTLSEVELSPIPQDALDLLLRHLGQALDTRGTDVSHLTSQIQNEYDNQGQIVEIMRDINEQNKRLIELMNRQMKG